MPKSKTKKHICYMDYAASATPNPSSIHTMGVSERQKLEKSRTEIAQFLSARPNEIIFTSGGTESNNIAIQGVVMAYQGKMLPHIITTNIEHPSVLETCRMLQKRKLAQISIVPVESNGIVDPEKIKKEIKKNTVLISVHYANNEIGTIQPIKEIAKIIRHYNKNIKRKVFEWSGRDRDPENRGPEKTLPFYILLHTDAVQAVNYLDMNVQRLGVDLLSLSGSKIESAGRIGVLYKKTSVKLVPIYGGGDQEFGIRPGTENVSGVLEFAKALELNEKIKNTEVKRLQTLRDYFIKKLSGLSTDIKFNGDLKNRLPNNVNITIPNIPSDLLVIELSAHGIMASAKSACKSGDDKTSYVIKAINPKIKDTDGSLRFSFGKYTEKSDIDYTIKALLDILKKLKKWY